VGRVYRRVRLLAATQRMPTVVESFRRVCARVSDDPTAQSNSALGRGAFRWV